MFDHKYITFRTEEGNLSFYVFSTIHQHKMFKHLNPISAGFVRLKVDEAGKAYYDCYGDSFSLGIKSHPERDSELLNEH